MGAMKQLDLCDAVVTHALHATDKSRADYQVTAVDVIESETRFMRRRIIAEFPYWIDRVNALNEKNCAQSLAEGFATLINMRALK